MTIPAPNESPFLTEDQWRTLSRWHPVRYVSKVLHEREPREAATCFVCGDPADEARPLHACHRVPFRSVWEFGLTPDWVNRYENLVWAHAGTCNRAAEFTTAQVAQIVADLRAEHPANPD